MTLVGLVLALLLRGNQQETPVPADSVPPQRPVLPVLSFPEPGLDDTAAYQGYQTRFYRDSKQNTVQIYLQPQGSRVVLAWADGANESIGFTVRDAAGRPAQLDWAADAAEVADSGDVRTLRFHLIAGTSRIDLGWFLLGSMRVERDFVYAKRHLAPFTAPPFRVAEESLLVADLARLPDQERASHLALLHTASVAELERRLLPTVIPAHSDTLGTVTVERPSLDGRNQLALQFQVDPRRVKTRVNGNTVSLQTRPGSPLRLTVKVATDATPLTPLSRDQIFNPDFLDFLAHARTASDSAGVIHYRRLERQVRGVELLSSEEKLMAGLPNFATYFGRDMMMTALMMRPIWSPDMAEHVIASVLRKLGPRGDVSHEEALGGQAIRENAVEYDSLITRHLRASRQGRREEADSSLSRAGEVLRDLQKTRENYHMIDDEFQLPVLAAHYLADPRVPAARKKAFLLEKADGKRSRLDLLLQELRLVASWTWPYANDPRPLNLVSFPKRDSTHWRSASWRDSDAGYAGGRFAMDVNAIWAPQALDAIATILTTLPKIGVILHEVDPSIYEPDPTVLGRYLRDPSSLQRALATWKRARRHFEVTLSPEQIRQHSQARLKWLPDAERRYWQGVMTSQAEGHDSIRFLALSLDAKGKPILVMNTDPATELFLSSSAAPETVLQDVAPFLRRYPVGLFVDQLGPLAANDAYAPRRIWDRFRADAYHGPRVVWGREVNLLLLGLGNHLSAAVGRSGQPKEPSQAPYVERLNDALRRTLAAVNASGLQHNELWSYEIVGGELRPIRYGTSSDVQLWNTTNLVVEFVVSRLPSR